MNKYSWIYIIAFILLGSLCVLVVVVNTNDVKIFKGITKDCYCGEDPTVECMYRIEYFVSNGGTCETDNKTNDYSNYIKKIG